MIKVIKTPLMQMQECWDAMSPIEQGIRWLLSGIVYGAMREQGWTMHPVRQSKEWFSTGWTGPTYAVMGCDFPVGVTMTGVMIENKGEA